MDQLTIMIIAPEKARADVMLRADRIYYRLATPDTVEDGDLPGPGDQFVSMANNLLDALAPREDENEINAEELKLTVFVDNTTHPMPAITSQGVRRLADELAAIDDVMAFIRGFA